MNDRSDSAAPVPAGAAVLPVVRRDLPKHRAARRHSERAIEPAFVGTDAAAGFFGIDRSTFYRRFLDEGLISTVRIGSRRLVPMAELHRIAAELLDAAS